MTSFEGDGCFAPEKEVYYDPFNFESFNTFFEDYAADCYHPDYIIGKEVDKVIDFLLDTIESNIMYPVRQNPYIYEPRGNASFRVFFLCSVRTLIPHRHSSCDLISPLSFFAPVSIPPKAFRTFDDTIVQISADSLFTRLFFRQRNLLEEHLHFPTVLDCFQATRAQRKADNKRQKRINSAISKSSHYVAQQHITKRPMHSINHQTEKRPAHSVTDISKRSKM